MGFGGNSFLHCARAIVAFCVVFFGRSDLLVQPHGKGSLLKVHLEDDGAIIQVVSQDSFSPHQNYPCAFAPEKSISVSGVRNKEKYFSYTQKKKIKLFFTLDLNFLQRGINKFFHFAFRGKSHDAVHFFPFGKNH